MSFCLRILKSNLLNEKIAGLKSDYNCPRHYSLKSIPTQKKKVSTPNVRKAFEKSYIAKIYLYYCSLLRK